MAGWKALQLAENKYTDAEAVAAVLAADDYVKTIGDTMSGDLKIENLSPNLRLHETHSLSAAACGTVDMKRDRTNGLLATDYLGLESWKGKDTSGTYNYGAYFIAYASGDATASNVPTVLQYMVRQSSGLGWVIKFDDGKKFDLDDGIIKDQKNHATSALSGTKKLVEIDIGGTPYYFEVYPTKA